MAVQCLGLRGDECGDSLQSKSDTRGYAKPDPIHLREIAGRAARKARTDYSVLTLVRILTAVPRVTLCWNGVSLSHARAAFGHLDEGAMIQFALFGRAMRLYMNR